MKKTLFLLILILFTSFSFSQTAEEYYNRGHSKADLKDYRGAIADYSKAIELKPDYAEAYNNRGYSRADLEDYRGAIADFSKAIELKPDALAFLNRGHAKSRLEDYTGAIADFSKAIELKPDYADAYNNRGLIKILLNQMDSGCLDLSKAGELGHPTAYDTIKEYCN